MCVWIVVSKDNTRAAIIAIRHSVLDFDLNLCCFFQSPICERTYSNSIFSCRHTRLAEPIDTHETDSCGRQISNPFFVCPFVSFHETHKTKNIQFN